MNIEWHPETNADGSLLTEPYADGSAQRIGIQINWTVDYLDERGMCQTGSIRMLYHSELSPPKPGDAAAERAVYQRLDLRMRGHCCPVVAALDPNQRVDAAWERVDDIVFAKRFMAVDSDSPKERDKGIANVHYEGRDKKLFYFTLAEKMDSARQLIYMPDGRAVVGPPIDSNAPAQPALQVDRPLADLLSGTSNPQVSRLQRMAPNVISRADIAGAGIDPPKNYLTRLGTEIESLVAGAKQAQDNVLEGKRSWMTRWIRGKYAHSEAYNELISYRRGVTLWQRVKDLLFWYRIPLVETPLALKQRRLEAATTTAERHVQALTARIDALPVGDAQRALLERERAAANTQLRTERAALQRFQIERTKEQSKVEGSIATMEALLARMNANIAQLESLLERNEAAGGFGLTDPASRILTDEEKAQWNEKLATLRQSMQEVEEALDYARNSLNRTGIDIEADRTAASLDNFVARNATFAGAHNELNGRYGAATRAAAFASQEGVATPATREALQNAVNGLQQQKESVQRSLNEQRQYHRTLTQLRGQADAATQERVRDAIVATQARERDLITWLSTLNNTIRECNLQLNPAPLPPVPPH